MQNVKFISPGSGTWEVQVQSAGMSVYWSLFFSQGWMGEGNNGPQKVVIHKGDAPIAQPSLKGLTS